MGFRDLIRMVFQNLNRMRFRVALTAIGVVIGTAAVVTMVSLGIGLQRSATETFRDIGDLAQITVLPGTYGQEFGPPVPGRKQRVLNDVAVADLRRIPGVVAASPQVRVLGNVSVRYGNAATIPSVVGIDPSQAAKLGIKSEEGVSISGQRTAIAGFKVGENFVDIHSRRKLPRLNLKGRSLTIVLRRWDERNKQEVKNISVRVVGVLPEKGTIDDLNIYLPLKDVLAMNEWLSDRKININKEGYSTVIVRVADHRKVLEVSNKIKEMGFLTFSLKEMLQSVNTFFLIVQGVLGGLGAIALLVAAFGIANTMTMAIYERTKEIGIMKALGATNRDIMHIFLAEAGAIGLLGGIIGALAGYLLGWIINFWVTAYLARGGEGIPSLVHTPLWLLVFAVLFATLVGVVSGVYPAMRAAALRPLVALRYE